MTALTTRPIAATRRATALYCATYGSGTPLLLLHSPGSSGAEFQAAVPQLAARYLLVVPDLRGHGQSQRLPCAGPDRMAADLADLLDLLGLPSCFVLGHAGAGSVAECFAQAFPARVRGLILLSEPAERPTGLRGACRRVLGRLSRSAGSPATLSVAAEPGGLAAQAGVIANWVETQEAAG